MPRECELVAYEADLSLIETDLEIALLKLKLEVAIRRMDQWMNGPMDGWMGDGQSWLPKYGECWIK